MKSIIIFVVSFLIAYLTIPILRRIAFALNILDFPGGRKIHEAPTPLLGGLAIYLSFLAGFFMNFNYLRPLLPTVIASSIIFFVGFINDIKELSVRFRLSSQVLACTTILVSGLRISFLPDVFWGNALEILVTFIWVVGVTNAYNCLDGLDGLAAGSAIINCMCFIVILYMTGQFSQGFLGIILIGACLGFLPANFSRDKRKIFLGESGSTFIGFMLACFSITGNWAADSWVRISIPALILGVPIFDMIFTTMMRVKEKKISTVLEWLQYTGRDHFHHYLVDVGFHPRGAVAFIYFISMSLGLSAIMVSNDKAFEAFITLSQASIIFGIIATLIVVGKRRRSGWDTSKT